MLGKPNITYKIFFLIIFTISKSFSYEFTKPPFKVGEYLEYEIYALGIKVATQKMKIVKITNINERECYFIKTDIETIPAISKIYHLHDTIETYIDVNTVLPVLIITKIKEGKWRNDIKIEINQEEGYLIYSDIKGKKKLEFKGNIVGLDSILYFLRCIKPENNENLEFVISKKREIEYLKAKALLNYEKMYIKPLKKYVNTTYYMEINKNAFIWVTEDESRLPVRIKSIMIPIGDYGLISFINKLTKYYSPE